MFLTRHYRYDLYATVNHMGSIDGGHYIAYMRVQYTSPPVRYCNHGVF